jgi:hypothetical protein
MALLATGCGGGGGTSTSTSQANAPSDFTIEDVTAAGDTIVADWGDEDGLAVLLLAVDAGYSIEQIVENPSITAAGTIAGVEPAGAALGLLEDPPPGVATQGASGAMLVVFQDAPPDWTPSDTFIDFVDNTAGDLFFAARAHLEDLRSRDAGADEWELAITTTTAGLLARGYTPDQVIEALLLGQVGFTYGDGSSDRAGVVCFYVEPDPAIVPPGTDRLADACPALERTGGAQATSTTTTTTSSAPPEPAPAVGDRYVGSIDAAATGADPDLVLVNSVDLVVGDDLTGTIELLGNATVEGFEDTSDGFCFYVLVTLEPGAVPTVGDGAYAGAAEAQGALGDGACPGGPPAGELVVLTVTIDAAIDGDTLTGVVSNATEEPLTFTATLTP